MIEKYKPLFIHLNPASIPEVVAHIQKYLTEHEFVTVDDFGTQFQEYIDAHPDIIKVGSVNGLTGDVVLTSENITMTGGTSETIGTVIGDILDDASATGETVDDLVIDMGTAKTNITNLTSDVAALENVFVGATEESSGAKGLVPAPANTQTSHYLKATGDFEAIPAREVISAAVPGASTVEQALTVINSDYRFMSIGDLPLTNFSTTVPNVVYETTFDNPGTYLVILQVYGNVSSEVVLDCYVDADNDQRFIVTYDTFAQVYGGNAVFVASESIKLYVRCNIVPNRINLRYLTVRIK